MKLSKSVYSVCWEFNSVNSKYISEGKIPNKFETSTDTQLGNTQLAFEVSAIYHKIPIINPGLIFVQKAVLLDLFSGQLIFDI